LAAVKVPLTKIRWRKIAAGAREKIFDRGHIRVRLLELTPTFVEKDWCMTDHAGMVLSGKMQLTLHRGTETLSRGDVFVLPDQKSWAHRARALTSRVVLLLFEKRPLSR
jgi:quercetin dioxygenase-like cupin family protein